MRIWVKVEILHWDVKCREGWEGRMKAVGFMSPRAMVRLRMADIDGHGLLSAGGMLSACLVWSLSQALLSTFKGSLRVACLEVSMLVVSSVLV